MKTNNARQSAAAALAGNNGFSLISNEKLIEMYTTMVKCRLIAERAKMFLQQSGRDGNEDAGMGQEAAAVGLALDLTAEDSITWMRGNFSGHFINDNRVDAILERLIRSATDSYFASSPSASEQIHMAIGTALANKTKKNGKVAVIFSNDRETGLDAWREALDVARVHQLPVLFVSVQKKLTEPAVRKKPSKDNHAGAVVPNMPVDGNDVVAVYRVVTESLTHARKGNGPTLIECVVERSKKADPILKMESYLTRKGLFEKELKLETVAGFNRELDAAIKAIKKHLSDESKVDADRLNS
jgi:pyruvate dehydrogenase E1 component alpha subunit